MNEEEKEIFIKLGQNIRALREERSMTILELSKITGVRTQYLKKLNRVRLMGWAVAIF